MKKLSYNAWHLCLPSGHRRDQYSFFEEQELLKNGWVTKDKTVLRNFVLKRCTTGVSFLKPLEEIYRI